MMIMMKVMITTVMSMMMMMMRDGESAITDDDDDDANDMQKFHPGNLDWIGELRNLPTPHEVYLMCRNMWKNQKYVKNVRTDRNVKCEQGRGHCLYIIDDAS